MTESFWYYTVTVSAVVTVLIVAFICGAVTAGGKSRGQQK